MANRVKPQVFILHKDSSGRGEFFQGIVRSFGGAKARLGSKDPLRSRLVSTAEMHFEGKRSGFFNGRVRLRGSRIAAPEFPVPGALP